MNMETPDSLWVERSSPLELAKSKIMTAEEYAEKKIERPYVFFVEAGNKKITYFGSVHSNNPDDPMWNDLERSFKESGAEVVFVEGTPSLNRDAEEVFKEVAEYETREDLIRSMGEPGFILKLAHEHDVECESPEPNIEDEIRFLEEQGFSQEEIFAYYFFRNIPMYHRQAGTERTLGQVPAVSASRAKDIKEYMQPYIQDFQGATQWDNFEYSYENAAEIGQRIWGSPLNLEDPGYYFDRTDPIPWEDKRGEQTVINRLSRESNLFRDRHVIDRTAERLQNCDKIFVVSGETHAVMQEPALRALLNSHHHEI